MAISGKILQTALYPFIDEVITVWVVGLAEGNRVRWRMLSVPGDSVIPVWVEDELPEKWLLGASQNGCAFTPVTDGQFVLEAVEETSTSYIPHFDGDGSETAHPIEEWAVVATEQYSIFAGRAVSKQLGAPPHTATLLGWVHASSAITQGMLTYYADRNLAPVITDPSTDIANLASHAADVRAELVRIGGEGYTEHNDLIVCDGVTGVFQSPFTLVLALAYAYNIHIALGTNGAHKAVDAVNTMAAVPLPTSSATFISFVNTFRTTYTAHIGTGPTIHLNGADTLNVLAGGAAADYATAVVRLNDLREKYEQHRITHSLLAHSTPGDGRVTSRADRFPLVSSAYNAAALAYVTALRDNYESHLVTLGTGSGYHATADSDNGVYAVGPQDLSGLIFYANEFADKLSSHTQNIDSSTHQPAASSYHDRPDYGGNLQLVPRAYDWSSAVALIDKIAQTFLRHIDDANSTAWHNGSYANPGIAWVQLFGANLLNKYFMDATVSSELGSPPNELTAVQSVLTIGGFNTV